MSNMDYEVLDYYTGDMCVAGQMVRHRDKVPEGYYALTVEVVATDGHGSLLCIRKPQYNGVGSGKWELPAGYVLSGETAQDAASRELQEETGLTAVRMMQFSTFTRKGMIRVAFAAYVPDLLSRTITLQPEEAVDHQFVTTRQWLTMVSTGACEPERCRAYTTNFIQNMKKYVGNLPEEKKDIQIPVDLDIGKTIRTMRMEQGMTQELLSKYANISRTSLAQIENGSKQPAFQVLCKIASAMDVRVSELIARAEAIAAPKEQSVPEKELVPCSLRKAQINKSANEPDKTEKGVKE